MPNPATISDAAARQGCAADKCATLRGVALQSGPTACFGLLGGALGEAENMAHPLIHSCLAIELLP